MKSSALFMLLPLLGACNVHSGGGKNSGDDVTINADETGNIAFNVPFIQGQVKVPGSMMHGGDFDIDGVKLMPGSNITGFKLNAGDQGSTVNISFKAPATFDQTRAYFLDQFKQKGVDASASGDGISGKSKDGSPFEIHLNSAGGATQGTIEAHDNQ